MRGHVLNALLSLVFAVLILAAVGSHLTTQVTLKVPVEVMVPADVIVSYQNRLKGNSRLVLGEQDAMTVTLSGPKEKVEALKQAGLHVLYSPKAQELEEALKSGKLELRSDLVVGSTLPKRVEVMEVDPPRLELTFSRVVERAAWVKRGEFQGEPAEGYRINEKETRLNVNQVRVRGEAKALENDPGTPERPYLTEPIDLRHRPSQTFTVKRNVLCRPQGVTALEEVEVTVVIEPKLEDRDVEFPIQFVRDARPGANQIERMGFSVTADGGWSRKLKLRGPLNALKALEETIERARNSTLPIEDVPVAYVRARELLQQVVGELNEVKVLSSRIHVTGLPEGVELIREQDLNFRVTLTPGGR
ncbi:MAG: hypothetical protein AB7N76_18355 [Planctomycetota bacterium]